MGDYNRDREPVDDTDRVRETERTTVIDNGGRRGGGGGVLAAVLILVVLAVVLFLIFGRGLGETADEVGVNVDVEAPEMSLPEIDVPEKVEVDVPDEINVDTDGGDGNTAE